MIIDIHNKLEIMSNKDISYWLSSDDLSDFISVLQLEFHVEVKECDVKYENFGSVFQLAVYLTGKINDQLYSNTMKSFR